MMSIVRTVSAQSWLADGADSAQHRIVGPPPPQFAPRRYPILKSAISESLHPEGVTDWSEGLPARATLGTGMEEGGTYPEGVAACPAARRRFLEQQRREVEG